ncbi:MAG: hypothetical protein JXB88_16815 [Spirochaetales bacterium]|nr:hypothetical protein [Spirochaetales bacterium]
MKKTFVHRNEFCTIEENGMNVSIIYGYNNGIALVQQFKVKTLPFRKYVLHRHIKDYKKRGFRKAGKDFKPEPAAYIYLEDYQLPERRYCENIEINHFFEAGLDSGYLYIREGRIDGLGTIKRYKLESGNNPRAAVNERDKRINEKLNQGYVERYGGSSYSLSVITSEYEAKQKARGTEGARGEEIWLEEKKLQREYRKFLE